MSKRSRHGQVRHIEMLWRCSSCQHKNLGRFKTCQSCANPKDGSEEYEMPPDPSRAASVTDEGLLRMASAGPDWRCAYCGSDQRRSDKGCANCGASALEGAEVPDGNANNGQDIPADWAAAEDEHERQRSLAQTQNMRTFLYVLGAIGLFVAFLCVLEWNRNRPRDFRATVKAVHWERAIAVERYQIAAHEGFKETLPKDAFEVRSVGKKVHHHEQVLDGYDTERYSVEVPDGYRTETYTASVSCGQDCTSVPETCSERCSSNKNGFATCRTVCSGGGQRCSTKYCDETRTRQVAQTRTEWRTRQVPRYRSEPRYAEGFAYKHWEWLPARTVNASGTTADLKWPQSDLGKNLGPGEKERETRRENYDVTVTYDHEKRFLHFKIDGEAGFLLFKPASEHRLHTEKQRFTIDGEEIPKDHIL